MIKRIYDEEDLKDYKQINKNKLINDAINIAISISTFVFYIKNFMPEQINVVSLLFASGIGINNGIVGPDMVLRICENHLLNNGETFSYDEKDLDEYRNRRAR